MAELDFKHHVSEIPRGEQLPEPVQRHVKAEISNIPNWQGTLNAYAENTNWMSGLGSAVATHASEAIATRLGGELGKNPRGELAPAFTDFDKIMRQSYDRQAEATLGIEAQKLITNSNLELASQPRLDSDMITKSQQSVLVGLNKILSLAPESVRGNMEYHYSSIMLNQNETLVKRMMGEQKEDRIDKLNVSSKQNAENVYTLTRNGHDLDKDGNSKSALSIMNSEIAKVKAAKARHDIKESEAETRIDTIKESYYSGKYARRASEAIQNKTLQDFTKELIENPPKDIPEKYRDAVYRNVLSNIQMEQSLRAQSEELEAQMMRNKIITTKGQISDTDWLAFESKVSPNIAEKVKSTLLQTQNSNNNDQILMTNLMLKWGDAATQTRSTPKLQNKTFDNLVAQTVSNSNGATSLDDAEVQVAMSAGANIPVFTETLQNKLKSGNPALMESAAQQMHSLYEAGAGHALSGLSDQDKIMFSTIESLRGALDPTEAMQTAINKIYNQSSSEFKANQDSWNNYLALKTKGMTHVDFALSTFKLNKSEFQSVSMAQVTGIDILNKYATNFALAYGDQKVAKAVTQRWIDENYGYTQVNGKKSFTMHPLEKLLGYENVKGIGPIIQQDARNSLNETFTQLKKYYDSGKTNEYWELLEHEKSKEFHLFSENGGPIKVRRHINGKNGPVSQDFDIVLHGNAFDQWDVAVYSKEGGYSPITQIAPYLGVVTYIPNKSWIDAEYNWRHSRGK